MVNKNTRSKRLYSDSNIRKKESLRKTFLQKRKNISLNFSEYSEFIANNLIFLLRTNPNLKNKKSIGLYWQLGSEVNTRPAIAALNEYKFNISLLSSEDKNFKFRKWNLNTIIKKNTLGYLISGSIMKFPKIIVCPILSFDEECNRLGRGGGHYDRFLKSYQNSFKIGLAYNDQLAKNVYPEDHDVKMDVIVTERKIYTRKN